MIVRFKFNKFLNHQIISFRVDDYKAIIEIRPIIRYNDRYSRRIQNSYRNHITSCNCDFVFKNSKGVGE